MTEPKRQYRPNAGGRQTGGRGAGTARDRAQNPPTVQVEILLLLGAVLVLAYFAFPGRLGDILVVPGLILVGLGCLMHLIYQYLEPVPLTLPSGSVIGRPRSRPLLAAAIFLPVVVYSLVFTKFELGIIFSRGHYMTGILEKIFQPDFSYFNKVWAPLVDTIKMSLMGSTAGSLLALPFAVLASTNINPNKVVLSLLRVIINVVRTLPTLIIASVSALVFGLGTLRARWPSPFSPLGWCPRCCMKALKPLTWAPMRPWNPWGPTASRPSGAPVCPRSCPPTSPTACTALR